MDVRWTTTEELIWGDEAHPWVRPGRLFNAGPGGYKLPAFNDTPRQFNVRLLSGVDNKVSPSESPRALPYVHFARTARASDMIFSLFSSASRALQVAVHSSKAVGEPPFFLGASVFFAIKNAIAAARTDHLGTTGEKHFRLYSPATTERIRMACGDSIAAQAIGDTANAADFQAKGSF
eukprot:scaffold66575_cov31-Tisochrysis_lutea.AAC.11